MDDQPPPFVPPSAAPPYVPPSAAPPYVPPVAAPPFMPPVAGPNFLPPPPPPRRGLSRGAVIGIVAGSLTLVLLLGGGITAAVFVVRDVVHRSASGSSSGGSSGGTAPGTAPGTTPAAPNVPHVGGAPSSATALHPLHCSASCFGNDFLVPSDTVPPPSELTALGLTKTVDALGDIAAETPGDEYDQTVTNWNKNGGAPDSCLFTYFQSPVVATIGNRPTEPDTQITYTGSSTDPSKDNIVTQSVRIFANSAAAEAHMRDLSAAIAGCPHYSSVDDTGTTEVTVVPAKGFTDFPTSEAAVGWVESSSGGHYESIDVQRGNLVVRTSLQTYNDRVGDRSFHSFVADDAWQIAAMLAPSDGH